MPPIIKVKVKVEVYSLISSAKRYSPDFTQLPPGHRTCSFISHLNSPGSIQPGCHFRRTELFKHTSFHCPSRYPLTPGSRVLYCRIKLKCLYSGHPKLHQNVHFGVCNKQDRDVVSLVHIVWPWRTRRIRATQTYALAIRLVIGQTVPVVIRPQNGRAVWEGDSAVRRARKEIERLRCAGKIQKRMLSQQSWRLLIMTDKVPLYWPCYPCSQ